MARIARKLQHLQKTQGSTTLFVTHDQIEALTMADRIAVLNEGRIIQVGSPEDIYDRPETTFVAQLVGSPRINLFEALKENSSITIGGSDLHLPPPPDCEMPDKFLLGIRPEDINPDDSGEFRGQITLTEPLGVETILHIKVGQKTLTSLVPGMVDLKIGDTVNFSIVHERIHCFGLDGRRIQT